ncbi:MAG: hypothetical protein ACTHOU_19690, partial [Aureliella sp.]
MGSRITGLSLSTLLWLSAVPLGICAGQSASAVEELRPPGPRPGSLPPPLAAPPLEIPRTEIPLIEIPQAEVPPVEVVPSPPPVAESAVDSGMLPGLIGQAGPSGAAPLASSAALPEMTLAPAALGGQGIRPVP